MDLCAKTQEKHEFRQEFASALANQAMSSWKDVDVAAAELFLLKPDWLSALASHNLLQKVMPSACGEASLPVHYRQFDAQLLNAEELTPVVKKEASSLKSENFFKSLNLIIRG